MLCYIGENFFRSPNSTDFIKPSFTNGHLVDSSLDDSEAPSNEEMTHELQSPCTHLLAASFGGGHGEKYIDSALPLCASWDDVGGI